MSAPTPPQVRRLDAPQGPVEPNDPAEAVRVERAGDAIRVTVTYSPAQRRDAWGGIVLWILVVVIGIGGIALSQRSGRRRATLLAGGVLIAVGMLPGAFAVAETRRGYRFIASPSDLTVQTIGLRERRRTFPRSRLRDVVVERISYPGWRPAYCAEIRYATHWRQKWRYLQPLPYQQIVQVVDSLREGLGMEKRSWP